MEDHRRIEVVDDVPAAAAERIAAAVRAGGHIALSGGSTPKAAHERVAGMELDWSAVHLWFGDDRAVPPDHEHSNYRMAKESLLDRISGQGPAVHRIRGELDPEAAAGAYEMELFEHLGDHQPPVLDLLLLGLGPDAHTASLFPRDPALSEFERWVVPVERPGMPPLVARVTLTLPVLEAASRTVFLISGEDKAEAVVRAFGGPPDPAAPASLVQSDDLTVLLDPPAASLLGEPR
jgi:6-phosphogluconolactonase